MPTPRYLTLNQVDAYTVHGVKACSLGEDAELCEFVPEGQPPLPPDPMWTAHVVPSDADHPVVRHAAGPLVHHRPDMPPADTEPSTEASANGEIHV